MCIVLNELFWLTELLSWLVCVFLRRFNILCYASGFYMLLFLRQMLMIMCVCVCVWAGACMCVCVCLFICIVQHNWACLSWKSTIEIQSLLLLLLLWLSWHSTPTTFWCVCILLHFTTVQINLGRNLRLSWVTWLVYDYLTLWFDSV